MNREHTKLLIFPAALAICMFSMACSGSDEESQPQEDTTMTMQITSPAFADGQPVPAEYTCDGEDISPPLKWEGVPQSAKSLALICDDPDAPMGTWVHWVLYGLPLTVTELAEGVPTTDALSNGARQGINDFSRVGYGGPCPPAGGPHRYFFKLYALDTELSLKHRATKQDLVRAMKGHVLAQGQLVGTYRRK